MKSFLVAFFGIIFAGGFGILCAVWAVVTAGRGEYLTTIVVLGFAGFCFGLVVPFIIVRSGKVTARAEVDATGTTIRPDGRVEVLTLVWGLVTVIAMGLFAALFPLGKLDIPVPHTMRYYLPFMSAAGAVMGVPTLWRIFGRGDRNCLRLTLNGFEFPKGLGPRSGEWSEVKDITDRVPGQPAPAYSAVVMVMFDGQTPTLAAGSFTPEGKALRELMRFYWQHPEHRGELTNGRALQRLSNEEFGVER